MGPADLGGRPISGDDRRKSVQTRGARTIINLAPVGQKGQDAAVGCLSDSFSVPHDRATDTIEPEMGVDHQGLGPRAPIAEAVVDINVRLQQGTQPVDLRPLAEGIAGDYPELQERRRFAGEMQAQDTGPPRASGTVETDGWLCFSESRNRVVQFRLDGYSYNWLRPYRTWAELAENARKHWESFSATGRIVTVTRIALRYINRFSVDQLVELDEYFSAAPKVPEAMPQGLLEYQSRVTIPYLDKGVTAQVVQALLPPSAAEFVIDINVRKDCRLRPDDAKLWDGLDELRSIKNEIFFSHVTSAFIRDIQGDKLCPESREDGE